MVYCTQYDEQNKVVAHLKSDEFFYLINQFNDTLRAYWPCSFSIYAGYLLAPFTLGLSFMLPNLCIADAKEALIKAIERQNRVKLNDLGLKLTYIQGFSTSWLELTIIPGSNQKVIIFEPIEEERKDIFETMPLITEETSEMKKIK